MHTKFMFDRVAQRELPVVLLIDDDLVSREVTATLLTMTGYTVHTAEGGEPALELLGIIKPGVILMDAQMPGLSGTELIAALRARTKVPIHVISGSNPPPEITAAADGYLIKPFDADTLHQALDGHESLTGPSLLDPDQPVVNPETLEQLRKMMPEAAVREIFRAVLVDLAVRAEGLEVAIAQRDFAEVRRIGHAIKGGCGMAGALQAAHLGALLESVPLELRDNQVDNSPILLRDLRIASQELERMLDAELPV